MPGRHRILLMLVGVSLLTSGQAECPPGGWEESRSSCYLFVFEPLSQTDAHTACINKGGNLTSVADEEENNFIYNLSLSRCAEAACPSVWFGLIKLGDVVTEPKEEGWTWLDGSTYDNGNYNKWKDNEPTGGMSCARMYLKDGVAGEWADLNCGDAFPYVCKRRATAAPSTTTTTTTTTTSTSKTRTISTPITTTTTTTPVECPPGGWEESRGSCYLFVLEPLSQTDAHTACINQGGNLTSVADEEENDFIYNLSLARCAEAACPSVWFGLIKMGDVVTEPKDEGWTWLDGSTYDNGNYNKWKANEPTGGVYCARMYLKDGSAGEWGDLYCGNAFPYVCKRRATAAPSTTTTTTTTTTSTSTTMAISTPITTTTTSTPAPMKTEKSSMNNWSLEIGVGVALFVIAIVAIVALAVVKLRKRPSKAEPAHAIVSQSRGAKGSVTCSGTIPSKQITSPSDYDPSDDYDNVPTIAKVYANVADDAAGMRNSYQHLTTPHSLTSNTDNNSYQHLTIPYSPMPDTRSSNYQVLQQTDTDRSYEALASPTEGKLDVRSSMEPAYEDISLAHCDYDILPAGHVCIK